MLIARKITFPNGDAEHIDDGSDNSAIRQNPGGRNALDDLSDLAAKAFSYAPERTMTVAKKAWNLILTYDLERSCAWTGFVWGLWVFLFQPISSANPNVRGLYLMNEVFAWFPYSSDCAWAMLTMIPAMIHLYLITVGSRSPVRAYAALFKGAVFLFVVVMVALANWRTTGVSVYFAIAFAEFACYAKITTRNAIEEK